MQKINLKINLTKFNDHWSPKIVDELNDSYIKLAKFKGEFTWHKHDTEDELFLVVKGTLVIKLRNQEDVVIKQGELIVIPKGIEHLPVAKEEVHVMLIEPKGILNTGNIESVFTKKELDRI
ncbi:MAG: cupin domain-containing protein [Gammaproteobacteria bacterium]|nr:cupin domain-containing protein [Gammaproteobacteria bacterium]